MMRTHNGIRSQPKLLSRNKNQPNADVASRDQLRMPEKMATLKYTPYNMHNKQNQNINKPEQPKNKRNSPYGRGEYYVRGLGFQNREKDERTKKTQSTAKTMNSFACMPKTRNENQMRKTQFQQMQEKVRDLESKILKIKQAIERKPQRKITVTTSTLMRNQTQDNMRTDIESSPKDNTSITSDDLMCHSQSEELNTPSRSQISNFVTQMPQPTKLIQCSSQTNLFSSGRQMKAIANKYYISSILSAFLDKTNNTTFAQLCRNHLCTSLQLLRCMKNIEKPKEQPLARQLKKPTKPYTIVFDLDQTLIHCNQNTDIPYDVLLPIVFPNGQQTKAGINVRPYAKECLKQLSEFFQIIVFTASHQCYGNVVAEYLDPNHQYISHRYFRDSCYKSPQGFYIKDLRVVDRPLERMLLVDNAAYSYAFQLESGIPVIPFYDCKTDLELKHLVQYLKGLAQSKDIRKDHCLAMKTNEYPRYSDPLQLINRLYSEFVLRN